MVNANLVAEQMSDLFTKYYRRKYKIENNGKEDSKLFAIVRRNVELIPVDKGLHSIIYKGNVELTKSQTADTTAEDKTLTICVKDYGTGRLVDSSGQKYEDKVHRIEARALEILTPHTCCLPILYGYEDKEDVRLILEYLEGNIFGKAYRSVSDEELKLLTEIVQKQPNILESELNNSDTIDEFVRAGLIHRVWNGVDNKLVISEKFSNRFKIEDKKLREKEEYQKQKVDVFRDALNSIFEFQRATKKYKAELVKYAGVPNLELYQRLAKTTAKLKAVIKYQAKLEGNLDKEGNNFFGKEDFIKKLLSEGYINEVSRPIQECVDRDQEIIQGDCYPLNMMILDKKIKIIDLSRISFGPWVSDFIDCMNFLKLLCGLNGIETKELYYHILSEKIRLDKEGKISDEYEVKDGIRFEEFEVLEPKVNLDRTIRASGAISGLLLNHEGKFTKYEQEELKRQRRKYLSNLRDILDTKSKEGKSLFANSRGLLEQILFK